MSPFEKACHALCKLDGHPENIMFEGRPMWMSYAAQVRAVMEAFHEPSMPMIQAADQAVTELGPGDYIGLWRAMLRAVER